MKKSSIVMFYNRPIALRFSYHFTYLSRTFVTRHDPLSTKTSNPVPFRPFFELARRVARPVTFTRLSRRECATDVVEAHEHVRKCISDRVVALFANSGAYGRRRRVESVRRCGRPHVHRRRVRQRESGGRRKHLDTPGVGDAKNWFCSG